MEAMQDKDGNTIIYNGEGDIDRSVRDRLNGTPPKLLSNLERMSSLAHEIEYHKFCLEFKRDSSGIVVSKGWNNYDISDLLDKIESVIEPIVQEFNREMRIEKVNEYNDLFEKITLL